MITGQGRKGILSTVVLMAGLYSPAWSDTIDGVWYSKDGKKLQIDGRTIVLPGGEVATGAHDRHHFIYEFTKAQPDGTTALDMVLVSKNIIHMRFMEGAIERDPGRIEIWKKCDLPKVGFVEGKRFS